MKTLTRLILPFSLAVLFNSFSTLVMAHENNKACTANDSKAHYVFMLDAKNAVITKTKDGYELALQEVDDSILFFSNQSVKKSGYITLDKFMANWTKGKDSFQHNPPNAALLLKGAQTMVFEMSNPQATKNGWIFHLTPLADMQNNLKAGTYHGIRLAIDSYGWGAW